MDDQIYYEACKDIARGTELLVWYGDGYIQFMGIPVSLKETAGSSFVSSEADVSTDGGDVSSSLNGSLCFALIWRCPIVAKLDSVCFILFRLFGDFEVALLNRDLLDMRIPPCVTIIYISTIISYCDCVSVNALHVCLHVSVCEADGACKLCMALIGRPNDLTICDLYLTIII